MANLCVCPTCFVESPEGIGFAPLWMSTYKLLGTTVETMKHMTAPFKMAYAEWSNGDPYELCGPKLPAMPGQSTVIELSSSFKSMAESLSSAQSAINNYPSTYLPPGGSGGMYFGYDLAKAHQEAKEKQNRVNEKWRPWFENLTPRQNEAVALQLQSFYALEYTRDSNGYVIAIREFPENLSEELWSRLEQGLNSPSVQVQVMLNHMPVLRKCVDAPCECYGDIKSAINQVIIHLNDGHRWTFTKIADWLDTLDIDLTFPIPE